MTFVLSFLLPAAIVTNKVEAPYIETVERINAESASVIVGRSVNEYRIFPANRSYLLKRQVSGVTGK